MLWVCGGVGGWGGGGGKVITFLPTLTLKTLKPRTHRLPQNAVNTSVLGMSDLHGRYKPLPPQRKKTQQKERKKEGKTMKERHAERHNDTRAERMAQKKKW